MTPRLPATLEVSALCRRVSAEGGFATVLHKGEADAGTLLVVLTEKGSLARVFERMPQSDGTRHWQCARQQESDDGGAFADYLARRSTQDPDVWIIELDVADGERFILQTGSVG